MAELREQEILNRNNIVALNEAFKRAEKDRQDALERVKSLERTVAMFQTTAMELQQKVAILTAGLHGGGSTT